MTLKRTFKKLYKITQFDSFFRTSNSSCSSSWLCTSTTLWPVSEAVVVMSAADNRAEEDAGEEEEDALPHQEDAEDAKHPHARPLTQINR